RLVFSFFFFQAEDGIRDFHVTGVQTCALPICLRARPGRTTSASVNGTGRPAGSSQAARQGEKRAPLTTALVPAERRWIRRKTKQIGRASCRERVERSVGAGSGKKKKETMGSDR